MRRAAALLSLGLVALTSGCTRPELSERDFQRRTAEICADTERRERALGEPRTDAEVLPLLGRVRALHRRETERIARLNPPVDREKEHDRAVRIGRDEDRKAEQLIDGLRRSSTPRADLLRNRAEWRSLGRHYGRRIRREGRLRGCVARRSTSLLP